MSTLAWIKNRHVVSALIATPILLNCAYASAEDAAPATVAPAAAQAEPESPHSFTFNLGLYSNYMFRGVALSDGPALQGGADYAHSSGFYAGTWFSNIDKEFAAGNSLEVDVYGGYAHTFDNGLGINLLGNYYWYPHNKKLDGESIDTFEVSAAISYKFLTYTYYNALTDYYGAPDSKNAEYHELKVNQKLPIGDLNFIAKVGYQDTSGLGGNQGDFAIGLNRDFALSGTGKPLEGFNAGAIFTRTFDVESQGFYTADGRDLNAAKLTFYVKRTW
ncbi:MAG: hypothetical protein HOO90_09345 [Methylotenera sp.]|uniref:TorF family putative porin n=1 Tax=Methylotenera sp. TaxID=2051956 RepID=UPI0017AEB579|nr:TorF family putative porin [Methylotenera sp.]NOU25730.1 hypothetical protein [Methylotenera sp.]